MEQAIGLISGGAEGAGDAQESFEPANLTSAQRTELDRRLDAYELDKAPGGPAHEAVESIRRRLG